MTGWPPKIGSGQWSGETCKYQADKPMSHSVSHVVWVNLLERLLAIMTHLLYTQVEDLFTSDYKFLGCSLSHLFFHIQNT